MLKNMETKSNKNNYDVQLFKPKFFYKPKSNISTAIRDTSCSRGWLRLVVQCTFGAITVTSFILIVSMSLKPTNTASDKISDVTLSKCVISNCKIQCSQAPYYDRYENDIVYAVMLASTKCNKVDLTLNRPIFINNTLPLNWLGYVESNLHYLEIVGGNLNNVRPDTFITTFTRNLKVLVFEDIHLANWDPDMLVGLSLVEFQIRHCTIAGIRRNALRTVDDTLRNLVISLSGDWDPANITGSIPLPHLTSVDFSFNIFTDILSRESFSGLSSCEIIYLNSCKITAIRRGTFDFLVSIKIIYLNNNLLVTLPPDIFNRITNIVTPTPRIDLQDNLWDCDCSFFDIMHLSSQGTLLVDPLCNDPDEHHGKSFSQIEIYCNRINANNTLHYSPNERDSLANQITKNYIYASGLCNDYNGRASTPMLISPVPEYSCLPNNVLKAGMLEYVTSNSSRPNSSNSSLLRPNFFIKSAQLSVIEISGTESEGYGLVWFHSNCPNEVHCVNLLPNYLRLYNVDTSGSYNFCPIHLSTGIIESDDCIGYDVEYTNSSLTKAVNITRLILYIVTSLVSLILGALCVYAVIIRKPTLLRGSKRVLFVKHKQVDALVLPPKLPLRSSLLTEQHPIDFNDKSIFITPGNRKQQYTPNMFVRGNSKRSTKSNAPSYISAIQPTEDQLKEWRLQHHFDSDSTITSLSSDISTYSWILNGDSLLCSVDVLAYDSLK